MQTVQSTPGQFRNCLRGPDPTRKLEVVVNGLSSALVRKASSRPPKESQWHYQIWTAAIRGSAERVEEASGVERAVILIA